MQAEGRARRSILWWKFTCHVQVPADGPLSSGGSKNGHRGDKNGHRRGVIGGQEVATSLHMALLPL